jgi:transcriptional regulator with XRE-family HTH domain
MPKSLPSPPPAAVDQAFGRLLRAIRRERGLSQEALGLASGNGRTFVSQLERGERGAALKTLFRLAPHLQQSPTEIVARLEAELRRSQRRRRAPE